MKSVVIFRWGLPYPGREPDGMKFAADSEASFQAMVDEGTIERYEWITSGSANEDDMMILWGDAAKLAAVMATEEMGQTVALGRYLMQRFRWDMGFTSDKATEVYGAWGAMLMEHATA